MASVNKPNSNNIAKCTWLIENYSSVSSLVKKKFSLPGDEKVQFQLRFLPNNMRNYFSSFVFVEVRPVYSVVGFYRLSILNVKNAAESIVFEGEFKPDNAHALLHFQQINVWEPFLADPESGFLQDDKLTIECEVHYEPENTNLENAPENHKSYDLKHIRNFEILLETQKYSDVLFVVGGIHEFKLHKNILTVSSPVFAAMFDSNLEESKRNRVYITDVDVQVFEELLRYIYSGKIPLTLDLYAHELFVVSDKYQLESLKIICEQSLSSNLKAETVIATLILSDMHSADHLKSKCLQFVRENAVEVKSHKDSWSQLKSRPELMMQMLDFLVG